MPWVPAFVARGDGTIINISSGRGTCAGTPQRRLWRPPKPPCSPSACRSTRSSPPGTCASRRCCPGAVATNFWDAAGGSVEQLPGSMVMQFGQAGSMPRVAGLDQGEAVTIPSLPDAADWHAYEAARQKLMVPEPLRWPSRPARYTIAIRRRWAPGTSVPLSHIPNPQEVGT